MLRTARRRVRAWRGAFFFLGNLFRYYAYDMRRYCNAASKGHEQVLAGKASFVELRSWIAADAHKLEKGLALREPRPGFGKPVARRLLENLEQFHQSFKPDHISEIAAGTLEAYCRFNGDGECHDPDLERRVEALVALLGTGRDCAKGGLTALDRDDILARAKINGIDGFFSSRHSIRNFADAPVSIEAINAAVHMAQRTPSVCNRQSWKAYVFLEPDAVQQILDCQQGNRGFGHTARAALVVTTDLRTFFSYCERNQGYVDGGMFAMSLVYALHAQGLGSCCLNWCVELPVEKKLRQVSGIPKHEAVIMIIAVGHLPESLMVAQSARKPLNEVCIPGQIQGESPSLG